MLALHSNDFSLLRTKLKVKMKPKLKTQQNSQNFRTMDMRIALCSPVWAIRSKNRILADPPLTMRVTSACTRAICRGYARGWPWGARLADHYSGHQRILSNWTFADICDIWRWAHWTSIIHVMVNWHLSKQGIRWPVSRDHIAGSCWVLIEVSCFFSSLPLTRYRFPVGWQAQAKPNSRVLSVTLFVAQLIECPPNVQGS